MGIKKCSKCGLGKETICFDRSASTKDGFGGICKDCRKIEKKAYRERIKNLEKIIPNSKMCGGCGENKSKEFFSKNTQSKDGLSFYCKDCVNRRSREDWNSKTPEQKLKRIRQNLKTRTLKYHKDDKFRDHLINIMRKRRKDDPEKSFETWNKSSLKTKYGITVEQYNEMLKNQNRVCCICGATYSTNKRHRRLCVDHNHITGKVRGLLCTNCNSVLGYAKVDEKGIGLLLKAIEYIKRTDLAENLTI